MANVYAITEDEYSADEKPIGKADSKEKAARMIRKNIAEETGDGDTGITAEFISYSKTLDAYFLEL